MLRCFVSLLSRLPLRVLYALADGILFPLMYYVVRYRRKVVRHNLELAFPEKTRRERKQIERDFYHQFCDVFVESIYGYRCSDKEMRARMVFEGFEQANELINKAGGGLFMLAHFGNWEWITSVQLWLSPGVTELNVYRRLNNARMDKLMLEIRGIRGGECVEKRRILREIMRYRNEQKPFTVALVSDQRPKPTVVRTYTTFLHQHTGWVDGGEVLGKKFGYPVFYLYITREKRGYYHVQMKTLSAAPKETAEGDITRAFSAILEQNILEQPALWLWSHNRWKGER